MDGMELTPSAAEERSHQAYRCFVDTCRSEATRSAYVRALGFFMDYLKIPRGSYDRLLDKDSKLIQMDICDFITYLRKRGNASASISLYVAAISKFYVINDVTILNWKKIKSFMGEHEKVVEDRPYIHSEIRSLLDHSSVRNRAMILLMSSSGLRVGALPILRIKDLQSIDIEQYQIYKVSPYAKSKRSGYFSFCTPEARKHIDIYLDHRKRWGERLTDDSPLFRTDYNPEAVDRIVRSISTSRIRHFVTNALRDCGLRTVPLEGTSQRTNIMTNHGFRKFFETNAFKAGMDHMYIRRLMGQKSGLEDAYLKLSEEELLEGDSKHVGYLGIVDQLTIDESNKLRREVQTLRVEKNSWEELRKEVDGLKELLKQG
jgi:integrase